jgi:hypothetical protein
MQVARDIVSRMDVRAGESVRIAARSEVKESSAATQAHLHLQPDRNITVARTASMHDNHATAPGGRINAFAAIRRCRSGRRHDQSIHLTSRAWHADRGHMIDWTCAQRSGTWSARIDGRLLATVRRAGFDWSVRWHIAGIADASTYPLRETAVAAVETRVRKLVAAGALESSENSGGSGTA